MLQQIMLAGYCLADMVYTYDVDIYDSDMRGGPG